MCHPIFAILLPLFCSIAVIAMVKRTFSFKHQKLGNPPTDPRAQLHYMFGNHCPLCRVLDSPHRTAMVACCAVESGAEFLDAVEHQDWVALSQFMQFEVMLDNYVLLVTECADGTLTWYILTDPFDLWSDADLLCWHDLDEQSAINFRNVYAKQEISWHNFRTSPDPGWFSL
jgi:hypothetical protein